MKVGALLLRTSYILHVEQTLVSKTENSRNLQKACLFMLGKDLEIFAAIFRTFLQKWTL